MRIACVQDAVVFANPAANTQFVIHKLKSLKAQDVDLVVFPEAFLTGYCVNSDIEARDVALPISERFLWRIGQAVDEIDIGCVVGYTAHAGDSGLINAATLFEPGRPSRQYVKSHLPHLGFDRFAKPGHKLDVFDTRWGKIGILICFDLRPPEAARTLALKGAELIVLPTNWPVGAEVSAEHVSIARAAENKVFVATCNRTGTENGTTFIGRSKIIHSSGKVLAAAGEGEETIIADIDLAEARQKRIVNIPGEYEMEVFACRQPDLYRSITEPN